MSLQLAIKSLTDMELLEQVELAENRMRDIPDDTTIKILLSLKEELETRGYELQIQI